MAANLHAVPDRPLRAIIYVRQSREREESISLEVQELSCREHCARAGYDVVDVLADPGLTGRVWKRREVQKAVDQIEAGDVDVIVVWKWSRFARNRLDWAVAVDKVESIGGRLESSTEAVDATTSTGRFARGMLAEMAAFESDRIGDTWREAHARRRRLGLPHNGSPRLGYLYDPEAKTYAPHPDEAEVVRELYRRYVAGEGLARLAEWLGELGIQSPRTHRPWTHRGVAFMLDAGFARGLLRVHDPNCTERHPAGKTCSRYVYVPGAQEPIITESTWQQYQASREHRATLPPRLQQPATPLSGVLRCRACGYRMVLHRPATQGPRFRCWNRACTGRTTVLYTRAEQTVRDWLPTVAGAVEKAATAGLEESATVDVERARLTRAVTETERALSQLTVDFARRLVPASAYESARDALLTEQRAAGRKLGALERAASAGVDYAAMARTLIDEWDVLSPDDRSRLLQELVVVWVSKRDDGRRGGVTLCVGAWIVDGSR